MKKSSKKRVSHIMCAHGRHAFAVDGEEIHSSGCDICKERLSQIATMVALGGEIAEPNTCESLAALLAHGLDATIGAGARTVAEMGGWRSTYIRWESNRHVEDAVRRITASSPAHKAEKLAKKLLRRMPVFRTMLECDFNSTIEFELERPSLPSEIQGTVDSWVVVPLQKGWLSLVTEDPKCAEIHGSMPNTLVLGKTNDKLVCMTIDKGGSPILREVA